MIALLRGDFLFNFFELVHQFGELAVFEFGSLLKIVSALSLFDFVVYFVDFFFYRTHAQN